MPIIRKVQSKISLPVKNETAEEVEVKESRQITDDEKGEQYKKSGRSKRVCQFCTQKSEPSYFDTVTLRRFISDRGRIIPRGRMGTCSKHQRRVAREIKRARHLALLPFLVRI